MNDILVLVERPVNVCFPAGDLFAQINLFRRCARSRGVTSFVDNLGIRSPEPRFDFLSSLFPFCPLLLSFCKDPGDTLLRILAFNPRGGLLKSGTCTCHVHQPVNSSPATVRGLTTDCVIGGADVVVHDLTTRVESWGWWTRRGGEFGWDRGEGEVEMRERLGEWVQSPGSGKNRGIWGLAVAIVHGSDVWAVSMGEHWKDRGVGTKGSEAVRASKWEHVGRPENLNIPLSRRPSPPSDDERAKRRAPQATEQ